MKTIALIVLSMVFALGAIVVLWAIFDGSYTGLFGVQQQVGTDGRVALVMVGAMLCLPGMIVFAMNVTWQRRSSMDVPPDAAAKDDLSVTLTARERLAIEEGRQDPRNDWNS